jgi:hypothetical protein
MGYSMLYSLIGSFYSSPVPYWLFNPLLSLTGSLVCALGTFELFYSLLFAIFRSVICPCHFWVFYSALVPNGLCFLIFLLIGSSVCYCHFLGSFFSLLLSLISNFMDFALTCCHQACQNVLFMHFPYILSSSKPKTTVCCCHALVLSCTIVASTAMKRAKLI